jgi:phosphatidylinositol glycan class N
MESSLYLAVAAIVVHTILFASIFDIYFTSPVESGMAPQSFPLAPPAKRVVLFVADGLRADTVYSLSEKGEKPAPYLREIIQRKGRWGVSHTRVPTESRPGHVALIAGLYEDVSAVTKGWQENPVQFDSVFNRSSQTWAWGSPDILPMFSKGAIDGRVETFMYDAIWEDFADADASKLDWWVFDKVSNFFETAKTDADLSGRLAGDKIVLFLHLLGIDTNGHAHRPTSKEVADNLKYVDEEIKKVVEMIESYFNDEKTAYVFTSDHGMTDWGSHGAGLPDETMTPLICWGAGIKNPRSNTYAEHVYHDGLSEKWKLDKYERVDVEQADIAPLMTTLFGGAVPVNSEGVLPIDYIHYNKGFVANAIETNSRQLHEQVKVKEERIRSNSLPFFFKSFPKMTNEEMRAQQERIRDLLYEKQYQLAIDLSMKQIGVYKEAVRYYHTYHRFSLQVALSLAFLGWMLCVLVHILEDKFSRVKASPLSPSKAFVSVWFVVMVLLLYQSSPLLYYLYYSLAIGSWSYVLMKRSTIRHMWSQVRVLRYELLKAAAAVVVILCGLELLVLSFFHRSVLSLMLALLSLWPYTTELYKRERKLCVTWTVVCLALSVFPILPVVGRNANYYFVLLAGMVTCASSSALFSSPRLRYTLFSSFSQYSLPKYLFGVQSVLLFLSSFIPALTNWFFTQKEAIPLLINVFSWCNLLCSIVSPNLGSRSITGRLLHIFLSLYTTFILLSTSFEALFALLLLAGLCLWLVMEDRLIPTHYRLTSLWDGVISFSHSKVVTILPNQTEKPRLGVSLNDLRQVFICLLLGLLSFFGTGNIASVNTFDPSTVYCFLTVFSPFVMGALILWKMVIPFIFVSCVFNIIISLTDRSLKTHLLLMLLMSDIMGLNFFFLVQDSGSWLEIGISISHYVIMMSMIIGIVILVGVARILTGVTVLPRKIEDHY